MDMEDLRLLHVLWLGSLVISVLESNHQMWSLDQATMVIERA